MSFQRKKRFSIPLSLILILLILGAGYWLLYIPSVTFTPPTQPDYEVSAPNVDISQTLSPGNQSITLSIQNAGMTPLREVRVRPVYGDFTLFPGTFILPTILNKGENSQVKIPINVPSTTTRQHWKIIYVFLVPMLDPENSKNTIYVIPTFNPAVEISFDSGPNGQLIKSDASYSALQNQISAPSTAPYCIKDAEDTNLKDGTNVKASSTIIKQWNTTLCGPQIQNLQGFPIWANFVFNGHGFEINDVKNFNTQVTLEEGVTGQLQIVYIFVRRFTVNDKVYLQPIGNSFWLLVKGY